MMIMFVCTLRIKAGSTAEMHACTRVCVCVCVFVMSMSTASYSSHGHSGVFAGSSLPLHMPV